MIEGPGEDDGYLIIGSNNTAMVGVRSVILFSYYEHYWQQNETHSAEIPILVNLTLGDDLGVLGLVNARTTLK